MEEKVNLTGVKRLVTRRAYFPVVAAQADTAVLIRVDTGVAAGAFAVVPIWLAQSMARVVAAVVATMEVMSLV
jgi:hypothetical protein